jgi:hypothetical protein
LFLKAGSDVTFPASSLFDMLKESLHWQPRLLPPPKGT